MGRGAGFRRWHPQRGWCWAGTRDGLSVVRVGLLEGREAEAMVWMGLEPRSGSAAPRAVGEEQRQGKKIPGFPEDSLSSWARSLGRTPQSLPHHGAAW